MYIKSSQKSKPNSAKHGSETVSLTVLWLPYSSRFTCMNSLICVTFVNFSRFASDRGIVTTGVSFRPATLSGATSGFGLHCITRQSAAAFNHGPITSTQLITARSGAGYVRSALARVAASGCHGDGTGAAGSSVVWDD